MQHIPLQQILKMLQSKNYNMQHILFRLKDLLFKLLNSRRQCANALPLPLMNNKKGLSLLCCHMDKDLILVFMKLKVFKPEVVHNNSS